MKHISWLTSRLPLIIITSFSAAFMTGCQSITSIPPSARTQVLKGDYQTGETSVATQVNTGSNTFNMIEVIKEPRSSHGSLVTVASAQLNPLRGTTTFRFKKPYTCTATSKTTEISDSFFVDEFIASSCDWIPAGSKQSFKTLQTQR